MKFAWPQIFAPCSITDKTMIEAEQNTRIGQFSFIHLKRLVMKKGAQIHPLSCVVGGGELIMEPYSSVGYSCKVITGTDTPAGAWMSDAKPESERAVVRGSITLGEGAFIGSGAVLTVSKHHKSLVIGEHSVVGANLYWDQDLDPNTIVHAGSSLNGIVFTPRQTSRGS